MAGFKQEKLFYPNRANWGVNHAEMSKVRWFILTASSDWGGDSLCRDHHKDKQMGTEGQSLILSLCAALTALLKGVLNLHCSSIKNAAFIPVGY